MNTKYFLQLGLTLVELLIVLSIVSILAAIAYPAYQTHVEKTRYADAKVKLLEVMQEQRKFFTSNNSYTDDLIGDLDYEDADGNGAVATDNEFYLITAGLCEGIAINECVLLTATPNFGDGLDTELTYNSKNDKDGPPGAW